MTASPIRNNAGEESKHGFLKRELGVPGATMMGLGSMMGTGVFVSIGIGVGIAGPAVILAILLAALLALCNALNSAQLAANHPVAGGTYEYGHKWLNSYFGFTAGWMFILAKSASASTAALGFAGYFLFSFGIGREGVFVPAAIGLVLVLTAVVMLGIRNSSRANVVFVSVTLTALLVFIVLGAPLISTENFRPFFVSNGPADESSFAMVLHAAALMFVAYTGYGRIATLGEEVHDPRRTIPRAILVTMAVTAFIYAAVGVVGIGSVGAAAFYSATEAQAAPLETVTREFGLPAITWLVAVGAMTAMLGVLLNLLLGLSRMVMALARRGDLPHAFARLNAAQNTPTLAVLGVGVFIAALAGVGDVRVTWSFSAFTVLIYYAITNLAALRLKKEARLYSPIYAWAGLAGCLFLAFWVEWRVWLTGLGLLGAGLVWHTLCLRARRRGAAK